MTPTAVLSKWEPVENLTHSVKMIRYAFQEKNSGSILNIKDKDAVRSRRRNDGVVSDSSHCCDKMHNESSVRRVNLVGRWWRTPLISALGGGQRQADL